MSSFNSRQKRHWSSPCPASHHRRAGAEHPSVGNGLSCSDRCRASVSPGSWSVVGTWLPGGKGCPAEPEPGCQRGWWKEVWGTCSAVCGGCSFFPTEGVWNKSCQNGCEQAVELLQPIKWSLKYRFPNLQRHWAAQVFEELWKWLLPSEVSI